jgi:hypothetical protein
MRPFSELAPGEPFLWQGKKWKKIKPRKNTLQPHNRPYNAEMGPDSWPPAGLTVSPWYDTFSGWVDVEEVAP